MAFASDLLHHPRRLWLRRAVFQVHLWAGVGLALYLIVISVSGSLLVWQSELTRWALPAGLHAYSPGHIAAPETVMAQFHEVQPAGRVGNLQMPSAVLPAFVLQGKDGSGRPQRWVADAVTARLFPEPRSWLDVTEDLHNELLLPPGWGMQVNAAAGAVLLLLAATGLLLWWPGVRVWTRGLRVNPRANWRRVNFDLHSAIGFWTLLIVVWWAISGVYFGFYKQVTAVVASVSPLRGMGAPTPALLAPVRVGAKASLTAVIAAAQAVSPGGQLWSVSDPSLRIGESFVLLDLKAAGDFSHRDIVRVRSADAQVISVWHYGERHSLGDWVLWSMHPLHFGTVWGPVVKVLWTALGMSLAVLTVTGLLMYWNRFLRRRW